MQQRASHHFARAVAPLAILCLCGSAAARAQDFHVRHYTVDDGLTSSRVQDISQDALGRMWFATRSGVAAYDGSEWSIYNLAHGLTWTDTFALRWDPDGGLWSVGSVFPFKVFSFGEGGWTAFPEQAVLEPDSSITSFAVGDGSSWRLAVGTNRGLLLSDGAAWRLVSAEEGLPHDHVTALVVLEGRLLVATLGGLVELRDGEVDTALNLSLPEGRREVRTLAVEEPASAAAASGGGARRLWVLGRDWIGNLVDGRFSLVGDDLPLALPSPATPLKAIADRRGGLYLGHSAALFHFRPADGTERPLGEREGALQPIGRNNGLLSDDVTALHLDREDNLWIGSRRGLSKIPNRQFATYNRRHGLLDDEVTAVAERRGGGIALAHFGGLSLLTPSGVETLDLTKERQELFQRPDRIRDLAEDQRGNLWACVGTFGLARVEPSGRITWFDSSAGLAGEVSSVLVDERARGGAERIWVGTNEGLFVRRGATFGRVSADAPRAHVRRIFAASGGDLLLATSAGLYRYAGGAWRRWECSMARCNSIFAVLETPNGVWVGTAAGLHRAEGDVLVHETAPAIEHPIYFMVRDADERIWFGIDNGVMRWDGGELDHFSVRDGLAGRETYRAAGLVDSRGRVWMGTERGVTVYSESAPGPPRAPPVVVLSDLEAAGRSLSPAEPHRLDHDANDVVFRFRAISLVDEERNQVRWWLEGFEAEWLPAQPIAAQEIRYTNLPPASYRLHVQAMNAEGIWGEAATSAMLTIERPYWQRPWFYVAAAGLLAAALFFAQSHAAQKRYSRRLEGEVEERVAQLREIEGELAKSQKLEAIGLLAGGIAHDFNNFLTVLLGNLSLLSMRERTQEQRAEDLKNAKAAVLRASKLTQQLLTFSRGGAPVRKATSIAEMILESASFVLSGSSVRCDTDLPEDLRVVEIDADQIHQLLNNLLINAMQAMPEGGTVRIAARNTNEAPAPLPPDRYVAVQVIDQGPGISEEMQTRIFDPYFTTKKTGKGIGLASAYSIAKRHDGLLTVDSRPGQGATFTLYLPASEAHVSDPELPVEELVPGSGRVLIMDDEESVRRVTGSMVEDLGYQVAFAADGEEAIERYQEALRRAEPFDAVIMDLTIPGGMGGREAISHLTEIDPSVRAIVISGYSNDEVMANYRWYGFRGVLSKPFRKIELARALSELRQEETSRAASAPS